MIWPSRAGVEDMTAVRSGANSARVWRQAPQGMDGYRLRLATATARTRMRLGPSSATARPMAALLGAAGEAEAGVFYVAAGDDLVGVRVSEQEGGADAEAAVRGVGVVSRGGGVGAQIGQQVGRDRRKTGIVLPGHVV